MTDRKLCTCRSETVQEAALLKATGAIVIAIGIGNADAYELRQIATDTSHVFNVRSFDFLAAIQQQILTEACAGTWLLHTNRDDFFVFLVVFH